MPANLTPEFEKAEERYRQAASDDERLAALREMLSAIPKHKGTEKMQADLKRRISHLHREQQISGHPKAPDPFHIPKSGAGQVVLIGPPNTGKSSLLAATTSAEAKVADYPFTTVLPQPGMWHSDDVQIELVDTPPITADHIPTGLLGTIRTADLACVVVEAGDQALEQIEAVLTVLKDRDLTLRTVLRHELDACDSALRAGLIVVNKADLAAPETIQTVRDLYAGILETLAVSARSRQGLGELFKRLWQLLGRVRIYAKQPGQPPDMTKPFTLPAGSSIADFARLIHRDLPERMKYARLWGHGRFEGQQMHKTEVLHDRDVVEIHE